MNHLRKSILAASLLLVALLVFHFRFWSSSPSSSSSSPSSSSLLLFSPSQEKIAKEHEELQQKSFFSNSKLSVRKLLSTTELSRNFLNELRSEKNGELLCSLLILGLEEDEVMMETNNNNNENINNYTNNDDKRIDLIVSRRIQSLGGYEILSKVLHNNCTESAWWKRQLKQQKGSFHHHHHQKHQKAQNQETSLRLPLHLPQDPVHKSEMIKTTFRHDEKKKRRTPVPVSERTYAVFDVEDYQEDDDQDNNSQEKMKKTKKTHVLAEGMKLFPIGFGIPTPLIRSFVTPHKIFSLNPALPRWCCGHSKDKLIHSTKFASMRLYQTNADEEYTFQQVFRHSFFAFTNRRGNYDCQRHSEILAMGTVPFMPELRYRCPLESFCLSHLPKKMMLEALDLPGIQHWAPSRDNNRKNKKQQQQQQLRNPLEGEEDYFSTARVRRFANVLRVPEIEWKDFDRQRYFNLARRMLNFTQHHLSTSAMVSYMLRTMKNEEPKSILLLVPQFEDYLSMTIESGLSELGLNYTTNSYAENSRRPFFWEKQISEKEARNFSSFSQWREAEMKHRKHKMYGFGFTWGLRIDKPPNPRIPNEAVLGQRILQGEFDLVIVSNMYFRRKGRWNKGANTLFGQHMPLLRAVSSAMPADRVAFIDTEDVARPISEWDRKMVAMVRAGSWMFLRELHEYEDQDNRSKRKKNNQRK